MTARERYGPWAVITGASEGTGAEFARQLAAQGLSCVLVARREAPLKALAEEIRAAFKVDVVTASVDLAAAGATAQIIKAVGNREVGLYISNAGADPNGARFLDGDITAWRGLLTMNALTPMECCFHFGTAMRARGKGGIILVSSGACYGGALGLAVYSGSKAFNLCFSESLWAELKPHGVDVLSLVMGQTDTPAHRVLREQKNMAPPPNMACAADVARVGIEQLPHGPIYNWGQANNQAGMSPFSADDRRARVEMISKGTIRWRSAAAEAGKRPSSGGHASLRSVRVRQSFSLFWRRNRAPFAGVRRPLR
jgi:uncharacterized protein